MGRHQQHAARTRDGHIQRGRWVVPGKRVFRNGVNLVWVKVRTALQHSPPGVWTTVAQHIQAGGGQQEGEKVGWLEGGGLAEAAEKE